MTKKDVDNIRRILKNMKKDFDIDTDDSQVLKRLMFNQGLDDAIHVITEYQKGYYKQDSIDTLGE